MVFIPFTSTKETLTCQCGSYLLRFDTLFNDYEGRWHFDLTDAITGTLLASSIPVVLGQDLLAPMNLGIGAMVVSDMSRQGIEAGPDDLGTRVVVAYYTPEEINELATV